MHNTLASLLTILALCSSVIVAQEPTPANMRQFWTASRITGSPEPPPPFQQTLRFPKLKFQQPLSIECDPAKQRLWVSTRQGKIWSFPDDQEVAEGDLFADFHANFDQLTKHTTATRANCNYGLAFHPNYPKVPLCWITYVMNSDKRGEHLEDGTRLSRFQITFDDGGIPRCDFSSERVLLSWLEGGHNGACVRFGPDGYLYVSAGDGEVPNPPDPRRAGQDVTNMLSTILRIDVSTADGGPLYSVPEDNPFTKSSLARMAATEPVVDIPNQFRADEAMPEIWAYGFRNPWKMSFGPDGQLWVGDVGWELYEMVYNVRPGGNYGWSIKEGPQSVIADGKRGPTPILPPALAYSHAEGASVTGGFVYRGRRFPELKGKYVFGDYETRRIWSADITPQTDGTADSLANLTDLVEPSVRIVAFGEDTSDELLLLHLDEGTIYGLEPNTAADASSSFPTTLSQTGLFHDTAAQIPEQGVRPFAINEPMWNDGAQAKRYVAVAGEGSVHALPKPTRMKNSSLREVMQFPRNSVLAKTITLRDDTDNDVRLETQILHFNGQVWNPYTYVWNAAQTDADLAPAAGTNIDLTTYGKFNDRKTWPVHSRSECLRCHNSWVGGCLAFALPQLNRPVAGSSPSAQENQLTAFQGSGLLTGAVPQDVSPTSNDTMVRSRDSSQDLNRRARSYLATNCAHCHQNGAGGTATIDLQFQTRQDDMKSIGAAPMQGTFQISNAEIVSPGAPWNSVLLYRTACSGRGRMPHIGSHHVHVDGVSLLREWIASLDSPSGEKSLSAPPHPSLKSTAATLQLMADLDAGEMPTHKIDSILQQARSAPPEIHNLLLRFQPQKYRELRNRSLDPRALLAMSGDAGRGATLFADKRLQCINCHRVKDVGGKIGPALDDVGKRLTSAQILESILEPSKKIDPKFAAWTAVTINGKIYSGLIVDRTSYAVVLRNSKNEDVTILNSDVDELFQQTVSLMPDRLLNDLTDQQIADLLAWLKDQRADSQSAGADRAK